MNSMSVHSSGYLRSIYSDDVVPAHIDASMVLLWGSSGRIDKKTRILWGMGKATLLHGLEAYHRFIEAASTSNSTNRPSFGMKSPI